MRPEEIDIVAGGLRLSALAWGPAAGDPVLALHGWLDNAATWSRVAPALATHGLRVVALEFAGHGHSEHPSRDGVRTFGDMVVQALDALDALHWRRAALLGHSMGGAVATLAAAVAPDRVTRLALVEGFTPLTTSEAEARDQFVRGIASRRRYTGPEPRTYPSFDALTDRISARPWPIQAESVRALAERGVRAVEGGWQFRHDPRLKAESVVRFTPGQVRSFVEAVACETLLVVAEAGLPYLEDELAGYLAHVRRLVRVVVPGAHHVHLDTPEVVLQHLRPFLCGRSELA